MVIGGLARSLINFRGPLLKALVEQSHEVVACAPNAEPEIREKLSSIGARYCHVPIARTGLSPAGNLKTLAGLRRIISQEQPDKILRFNAL